MAATLPQPSRPSLNPPQAALPPLPPGLSKSLTTPFETRTSGRLPSTSYGSSRLALRPPFGLTLPTAALFPQHASSTSNIPTIRSISDAATRDSSPTRKTLRKPISMASFPQPPRGNTRIPSSSARALPGSVTPTLSAASSERGSWNSDRSLLPSVTANMTRRSASQVLRSSSRPPSDSITPTASAVSSKRGSSSSGNAGFPGSTATVVKRSTSDESKLPRPSSRPTSQTVTPTSSAPVSRRGSVDLDRPVSSGNTITAKNTSTARVSRIPSFASSQSTKLPLSAAARQRGSSDSSGSTYTGGCAKVKRPGIPLPTRASSISSRTPAEDVKIMLSAVARKRGSSESDGSTRSASSTKKKGTSIPRTAKTFRISSCPPSESVSRLSLAAARKRGSSDSDGSEIPSGTVRKKRPIASKAKSSTSYLGRNNPSLLNGSGAVRTISGGAFNQGSEALAGLPSPLRSRISSAEGSYSTTATTFEDVEDSSADGKSPGEKKGNVVVSVRVRPNAGGAKTDGEWAVDGRRSMIAYRGREGGEYHYDNVFSTTDKNDKVYDACAKRLVRRVMEGYNGTVFAYGMTGTGKTFSMQGTATSLGVIPLAIADIFSYIRQVAHLEFLLRVSYLEIYNEKIYDLLSPQTATGPGAQQQEEIKLREDSTRGVYASPLREEVVQSPTQLLRVIAKGDHARRTCSTQFNARSSRSHAVVQIVVESRERTDGGADMAEGKRADVQEGGVRVSTLSLIDLAGSERAAENKERRTEGSHINKSLLTLGTVIARLSGAKEPGSKAADKDGKHLPYRDSKLTRLLQPALSGDSLVSILCTIQCGAGGAVAAVAANGHTGETLNTLKFAARAKNNIVSHAKRAEAAFGNGPGDAGTRGLLERYRAEIQNLRGQLERAAMEQTDKEERKLEKESQQRHEEQMLEMHLARVALKERITHLNRLILSSQSTGVNKGGALSSLSAAVGAAGADGSVRSSGSEDTGSLGGAGDGVASLAAQVRALRADLAERDRYIATLEKRLWQARRASHSRTSVGLSQRASSVQGTMASDP